MGVMASETQNNVGDVTNNVEAMSINGLTVNEQQKGSEDEEDYSAVKHEWGFALPELYKLVVKFYKGMCNGYFI